MTKRILFGTDGIRGISNQYPLTPEMVQKIGMAAAHYAMAKADRIPRHKIIVGMDTRISSDMIFGAIASGITSAGVDVVNVGITTTPSISYLVKEMSASMGIMISASHNPFQYNGIKFFNSSGKKFSELEEASIELLIFNKYELPKSTPEKIGRILNEQPAKNMYKDLLVKASSKLNGLKVALDCGNGSTYIMAPEVFKDLGAIVYTIGCKPDGYNINENCGATHPEKIAEEVREIGADIGFAYDGDGDRCIAVDSEGRIFDGDYILALLSDYFNESIIVSTVMSNLGLETYLNERGKRLVRSKVGDRNVFEKMEEVNATIGGEQSGHIILKKYLLTGDGILTSLLVSSIVMNTGKSLSELLSGMKKFPQKLKNVKVKQKKDINTMPYVLDSISKAKEFLGEKGRILVRYSGTEPMVRIMVESEDESKIEPVIDNIVKAFREEGIVEV